MMLFAVSIFASVYNATKEQAYTVGVAKGHMLSKNINKVDIVIQNNTLNTKKVNT